MSLDFKEEQNLPMKMRFSHSVIIADGLTETCFQVLDNDGDPTDVVVSYFHEPDSTQAIVAECRHGSERLDISNPSLPIAEMRAWVEAQTAK